MQSHQSKVELIAPISFSNLLGFVKYQRNSENRDHHQSKLSLCSSQNCNHIKEGLNHLRKKHVLGVLDHVAIYFYGA